MAHHVLPSDPGNRASFAVPSQIGRNVQKKSSCQMDKDIVAVHAIASVKMDYQILPGPKQLDHQIFWAMRSTI